MQDSKGNAGQARRVDRKPRVTPDMFWPGWEKGKAPAPRTAEANPKAPNEPRPSAAPPARTWERPRVAAPTAHPSALESRMRHPSARRHRVVDLTSRSAKPELRVILQPGNDVVELSACGNRCGTGVWCQACRADIRAEALYWLHELNVVRPPEAESAPQWGRAWSREFLLADS